MDKRKTIALFLFTLLTRLAVGWQSLLSPSASVLPDSFGYFPLAEKLMQGSFPSIFRTPGYPLFLAITGARPGSTALAVVVQMLLDCFTAVLLAHIVWRLLRNASASLLTGVLWALCPVAAAISPICMSETLFMFLAVAAFYLALSRSLLVVVLGQGLCWSAAALTRPAGVLLPLIICFFIIILRQTDRARRLALSACLLIYILVLGAWAGFNYYRAGYANLTSVGDVYIYGHLVHAVSMADEVSWLRYTRLWVLNPREGEVLRLANERRFIREALQRSNSVPPAWADDAKLADSLSESGDDYFHTKLWSTIDDPATVRWLRAEADEKLKGRLPAILGVHLVGALQTLRPIPPWGLTGWPGTLIDSLRLLLLPIAFVLLARRRQWWLLAFCSAWFAYTVFLPGVCGIWRYRVMAEPAITHALAFAFSPLIMRWHLWRRFVEGWD
ncbi:MAG: hypothetical protein M3362_06555 [Acidobacteriota bacterium]|nr:hypothetical protein [Acidobacteriota bacterium]